MVMTRFRQTDPASANSTGSFACSVFSLDSGVREVR
jgi:hypothetical protein